MFDSYFNFLCLNVVTARASEAIFCYFLSKQLPLLGEVQNERLPDNGR